jgi:hypothetical protein
MLIALFYFVSKCIVAIIVFVTVTLLGTFLKLHSIRRRQSSERAQLKVNINHSTHRRGFINKTFNSNHLGFRGLVVNQYVLQYQTCPAYFILCKDTRP